MRRRLAARPAGEAPMPVTVPPSLLIVLQALRPCFTAPSFATLAALVTGALSGAGRRTVTGMWQAAGLAGSVHWSRAHRFFSRAVWDLDRVGLTLRVPPARLRTDLNPVGRNLVGAQARRPGQPRRRQLPHLVQIIRHGLKKIQYQPRLIEGCLAGTGLTLDPY